MFKLDFSDFSRVVANLGKVEDNMRFVTAYAMTNAMKDVREAEYASMRSVFDKPTSYTLNSLQVVPATKARLRAELRFKEFGGTPAWKYLGPQVRGGSRKPKGFERALQRAGILRSGEYAMPAAGMKLSASGNVSGGKITQILSAIGASTDPMQNRTAKSKRKKRNQNQVYFVLRGTKAPAGIYQRVGKRAVPVLIFVQRVSYRARYPHYETARRVFGPAFKKHFHQGFERYVVSDFKKAA